MPVAYSYIRFSTKAQADGDSIRRQVSAAQKWADSRGMELITNYQDHGVSGYRGKNSQEGALKDLLDAINDGVIEKGSYIVVESLDRLSRDVVTEAVMQLLSIIKAGVNVVTLTDRQEYTQQSINDNGVGLMLSLTVMLRAHEESRTKSYRITEAWENKRKRVANGKDKIYSRRCPSWLDVVDGEYQIDNKKGVIVKRIFEEAINGRGAGSISRAFNKEQVPTLTNDSKFWHESTVKKVLHNRAAYGVLQPKTSKWNDEAGKREVINDEDVEGFYPAVIEKDTFYAAKAAISDRKVSGRVGVGYRNLFKGLMRCGLCGESVHFINKGKPPKGATYFHCSNAKAKAGCKAKVLRYDPVEDALTELFVKLDYSSMSNAPSERARLELEIKRLETEKLDLEVSIDNLVDVITRGASSDAIISRLNQLETNKQVIDTDIEDAKVALGQVVNDTNSVQVAYDLLKELVYCDDTNEASVLRERLNSFYRRWVDFIEVLDKRLIVHYKGDRDNDDIFFNLHKKGNKRIYTAILNDKQIIGSLAFVWRTKMLGEDALNEAFTELLDKGVRDYL